MGRFDVVVGGSAVPLGGHRQRAVLAVLTVHANEIVSVDRLVDEVWNGRPPASAVGTLQRYVSHLRRALDGLPVSIDTRRPGYVLRVDPGLVDAQRFEQLVDEGRRSLSSGAVERASSVLREALGLWRGAPLADFSDESFAQVETTRLEELRLTAVELRLDADLALGLHRDLIPELEALVATHPLRESYRGQLMRALHGAGRRADALRMYSEGRRLLAEELGLDPSSGLQRLEHAILVGDPAIEPQPTASRSVARVGRLPAELTSFVGRATEVQEVADSVGRSRLVTLTGVGGSGKSRLALRVATELAPSFGGGAWLVELAGITDPATVPRAVATALGVRDDADRDIVESLLDSYRQQECLVVVDGCEHILDAVAPLVERVLVGTAAVRILATSREALGLPCEAVYRVPTLPVPDAMQLFVERAASVDSSFRSDDHSAAIVEVCRRLDGIPLALELAAARMDVLTPRQLADRLDDRFELLGEGRRAALPRHRTLRATIDWSYALLTDVERVLFERLAVFAGSFTVESAEAVCADDSLMPTEVVDVLGRLVRKSLVVRVDSSAPTARYRLLDTLRDYGRDRLQERDDAAVVRSRHAAWFTEVAERLAPATRGPGATRLLEELDTEQVEFPAALAWLLEQGDGEAACRLAVALMPYWDTRFHVREARMWLGRALAATAADEPPSKARLWAQVEAAYFALMEAAYMEADMSVAVAALDEASRLVATVSDPLARARVLTIRGDLARVHDELDVAWQRCQEATELCRQGGSPWNEADAHRILALVALDRGDLEGAATPAAACLRLYQSTGDIEKTAGAQVLLGAVARDRGRFGEAAELFEQSLSGFQQVGERLGAGFTLWLLSEVAAMQGDADSAARFAGECLRVNEELGFQRGIIRAHHLFADAFLLRGDLDAAETWCARAVDGFRGRGYHRDLIQALETTAVIRMRKGDVEGAATAAEEALGHARARGYGGFARGCLCLLASVRIRQGRGEDAAALSQEALASAREAGDVRARARALTALADVAVAEDRRDDAVALLSEARATLAAAGAEFTAREATEYDRVHAATTAPQLSST